MKITSSQLKKIIKEEVNKFLNEWDYYSPDGNYSENLPSYDPHFVQEDEIYEYLEGRLPEALSKTFSEYSSRMDAFEEKNPELYGEMADLMDKKIEVELYGFDGEGYDSIDIYIDPEFKQFLETKLKTQEPELYQFLVTEIFDEDTIGETYLEYAKENADYNYTPDEPEYDDD